MSNRKGALVCVTGATGFIAAHIVKLLLERGYRVRGTVRDSKGSRVNFLRDLPGAAERLELVDADLLGPIGTFDAAVQGCTFVLHTASPFFVDVKDPQKELVDPALKGTESVLVSCLKHQDTIEKVVVTSSMAAITDSPDNAKVYSEADWNTDSSLERNPYYYSKVLAEKFAYDFEAKNKPKWALATINPSMVFGPALNDQLSESVDSVLMALVARNGFPMVLDLSWSCVDVRDVALAHVLAAELKDVKGRHVCVSETIHLRDLIAVIKKHFPKAKLPDFDMSGGFGSSLTYFAAYFYPQGKRSYIQTNIGHFAKYTNAKIVKDLGMQFRTAEAMVVDTINDLIARKKVADLK